MTDEARRKVIEDLRHHIAEGKKKLVHAGKEQAFPPIDILWSLSLPESG